MNEERLPFKNRRQAGRVLAEHLEHYRGRPDLLVLALPRGGVAVGFEVAHALQAPLDVFVVRKLGFPGHEEYAMGAIASGGVRVMNPLPGATASSPRKWPPWWSVSRPSWCDASGSTAATARR